jgi:myo-inositol-1-phosphate synthase
MSGEPIGVWLIGAWGRKATATAVCLSALQERVAPSLPWVGPPPQGAPSELAEWDRFVLGGHEIRRTSCVVEAARLFAGSRDFDPELLARLAARLRAFDRNVRTGTLIDAGPELAARAATSALKTRGEIPRTASQRIAADLDEFRAAHGIKRCVVVNLASREPNSAASGEQAAAPGLAWPDLEQRLNAAEREPVAAATLYAVAALRSGCAFLNVARARGGDLPALEQLAERTGMLYWEGPEGGADRSQSATEAGLAAAVLTLVAVRFAERQMRFGQPDAASLRAYLSGSGPHASG